MEDEDWLKSVKEGDTVFYEYRGFSSTTLKPVVVQRVTKTQVIVNETKYRLDGTRVGAGQYSRDLKPYNEENKHIFEVQENRLLVDRQWDELQKIVKPRYIPEEKLDAVSKILTQLKEEVT